MAKKLSEEQKAEKRAKARTARQQRRQMMSDKKRSTFCEEKGHREQDCHQANFGQALKRARDEMLARVDSTFLARFFSISHY